MRNCHAIPLTQTPSDGLTALLSQVSPEINGMLHLSVFPNDEYRETVLFLVCMSIAGTFIWDRLCLLLFGLCAIQGLHVGEVRQRFNDAEQAVYQEAFAT